MQLNSEKLVLALKICLVSMLVIDLVVATTLSGILGGEMAILLLLAVAGLWAGTGLCAYSVSGSPRYWACLALGLTAMISLPYLAPSFVSLGILSFFAGLISLGGMILSLGRALGDKTTARISERAISVPLLASLICLLIGIVLEQLGVDAGAAFIYIGFGLGPILVWLCLTYLLFLLIPRIKSLRDGQAVGTERDASGPAF